MKRKTKKEETLRQEIKRMRLMKNHFARLSDPSKKFIIESLASDFKKLQAAK